MLIKIQQQNEVCKSFTFLTKLVGAQYYYPNGPSFNGCCGKWDIYTEVF